MKTLFIVFFTLFFSNYYCFSEEYQIPFDSDKKIMEIDSSLDSQLNLFTEYPNLISAKLFTTNDSLYILKVEYMRNEKKLSLRKMLSFEQFDTIRNTINLFTLKNIEPKVTVIHNRNYRREFLSYHGVFSGALYGPLGVYIAGSEVPGNVLLTYAAVSGASFLIPYFLTKNVDVSEASASLYLTTSILGLIQSNLIYMGRNDVNEFSRNQALYVLIGTMAESAAGYLWADWSDMTPGEADLISFYGFLSIGNGAALPIMFGNEDEKACFLSAGLMPYLGMYIGSKICDFDKISRGDASIASTFGLLGAYYPIAAGLFMENNDLKYYAASFLLGSSVGLFIGHQLIDGFNYKYKSGLTVQASAVLGGVLGGGLGYLIDNKPKNLLAGSIVGSAVGLTWSLLNESNKVKKDDDIGAGLRIDINPYGLTNIFMENSKEQMFFYNPIVNLSYKF